MRAVFVLELLEEEDTQGSRTFFHVMTQKFQWNTLTLKIFLLHICYSTFTIIVMIEIKLRFPW